MGRTVEVEVEEDKAGDVEEGEEGVESGDEKGGMGEEGDVGGAGGESDGRGKVEYVNRLSFSVGGRGSLVEEAAEEGGCMREACVEGDRGWSGVRTGLGGVEADDRLDDWIAAEENVGKWATGCNVHSCVQAGNCCPVCRP